MSTHNNGSPAFPSHGSMGEVVEDGMSLLDYFAAKALQTKAWSVRPYDTRAEVAKDCYEMARAMMAESKK